MYRVAMWTALCIWLCTGRVGAIQNGSFADGLLNWKAAWHTTTASGEAVLSDAQDTHAFLFQAERGPGGSLTVSFDFLNGLSGDVPTGTFRDSFYASIYQVDRLSDFVLEHDLAEASLGLVDLDAGGAFDVNGTVTASSKGGAWLHFEGTISVAHAFVVIAFELHDLNLVPGDSSVRIDNVSILGESPEP